MSLAIITIDTETQKCILTVNGMPINASEIKFYYGGDYGPPGSLPTKIFKYTVSNDLPDGGTQDIEYEMAEPEQLDAALIEGMIKREVKTKDKLYKEVEAFVNESNAAVKVVKNGPTDTPYCVMLNGKAIKCYPDMKMAQDHMNRMGG